MKHIDIEMSNIGTISPSLFFKFTEYVRCIIFLSENIEIRYIILECRADEKK